MKSNASWRCRAAFAVLLWVASSASAVVVNGLAVATAGKAYTVRDVRLYSALKRWVEEGSLPDDPYLWGKDLKKASKRFLFETMVFDESQSLKTDLSNERREFEKWFSSRRKGLFDRPKASAFFNALHASETGIKESLFRHRQFSRFLPNKIETLTPVITRQDIERYLDEQGVEPARRALAEPEYIRRLRKERLEKNLEDWIAFLRDKYQAVDYLENL